MLAYFDNFNIVSKLLYYATSFIYDYCKPYIDNSLELLKYVKVTISSL